MNPRLYIVMREDLWDMNPGKGMAQAAHAQAEFDAYVERYVDTHEGLNKFDADFVPAVTAWKERRTFGTTLVLSAPLDDMGLITFNVNHYGYVEDPTYPYRNYYGKMFTRKEFTCMWAFVYTEEEIEYMKQFDLHR